MGFSRGGVLVLVVGAGCRAVAPPSMDADSPEPPSVVVPSFSLTFGAPPLQGSIVPFTITNEDPFAPFDDTTVVVSSNGIHFYAWPITADGFDGRAVIDVDAVTASVYVVTGDRTSLLGHDVAITPRPAIPLTVGTVSGSGTGIVDGVQGSVLYKFTPESYPSLTNFSAGLTASFIVLGGSGRFVDATHWFWPNPFEIETSAEPTYLLVMAEADYTVGVANRPLVPILEADLANDLPAGADELTLPALVDLATFSSANDIDWYRFEVTSADVGKRLSVWQKIELPPLVPHPLVYTVFAPGFAHGVSLGEDPFSSHRISSGPLAEAGTYYIRVEATGYPYRNYSIAVSLDECALSPICPAVTSRIRSGSSRSRSPSQP